MQTQSKFCCSNIGTSGSEVSFCMLAHASIDSLHNWAPTNAEDASEHQQGHDMGSDHTSRILWPSDRSPSRSFTLASIAASIAYNAAIQCQVLCIYMKSVSPVQCNNVRCFTNLPSMTGKEWWRNDIQKQYLHCSILCFFSFLQ